MQYQRKSLQYKGKSIFDIQAMSILYYMTTVIIQMNTALWRRFVLVMSHNAACAE